MMIDFFGIKHRQMYLCERKRNIELQNKCEGLSMIIEAQALKLDALRNEQPFMYEHVLEQAGLDFPNSKR